GGCEKTATTPSRRYRARRGCRTRRTGVARSSSRAFPPTWPATRCGARAPAARGALAPRARPVGHSRRRGRRPAVAHALDRARARDPPPLAARPSAVQPPVPAVADHGLRLPRRAAVARRLCRMQGPAGDGVIEVHTHVVPEDFPAYAGRGRDVPWPSMVPAQACHRHVMVSGKVYRTVSHQCWACEVRLAHIDPAGVETPGRPPQL